MIKRLGQWAYDHPFLMFFLNFLISLAFFLALGAFLGCSRHTVKQEDYGRKVVGPRSYGSVDEPDMAH